MMAENANIRNELAKKDVDNVNIRIKLLEIELKCAKKK